MTALDFVGAGYQPSLAGSTQFDPTTPEIGRDNELINENGKVKNIYDSKPGTDSGITKRVKTVR